MAQFTSGVNLMINAAKYLAELEPDPGRACALAVFADAADKYKLEQLKLYSVLATADGPTIGRFGGDAYALVSTAPQPMWGGQARHPRHRPHEVQHPPPRRPARGAVGAEALDHRPDPAVRAAANAASNLTLEQYRMLRPGPQRGAPTLAPAPSDIDSGNSRFEISDEPSVSSLQSSIRPGPGVVKARVAARLDAWWRSLRYPVFPAPLQGP